MSRRRRKRPPIKFTLRLYPGQDDDLIRWLDGLDESLVGAKSQAVKEAIRRGRDGIETSPTATVALDLDLAQIRQVVEAAVEAGLSRRIPALVQATGPDPDESSEVDDLLDDLQRSLVLGQGEED